MELPSSALRATFSRWVTGKPAWEKAKRSRGSTRIRLVEEMPSSRPTKISHFNYAHSDSVFTVLTAMSRRPLSGLPKNYSSAQVYSRRDGKEG